MLQRRGFRVVVANDGASAIELFRHIAFHAVVLDYSMPDLSGGEVARVLRGKNPQIPIILHTGYKELSDPLLANVTCTLPKGSLGFLVTKLNDLLHLPEVVQTDTEVIADAELPAESQVA
jgi:CheY-like chemotaxis protein